MNTQGYPAVEMPMSVKVGLLTAAWVTIFTIMVLCEPTKQLVYAVPILGVYTPVGGAVAMLFAGGSKYFIEACIPMLSGWLYYVALTVLAFRSTRRWVFFSLYAVLCANLLWGGFVAQALIHFHQ